jgi:hypothetical protein
VRRIRGHGDRARIQAAKKGRHIFQAGGVEEQHRLAADLIGAEQSGYPPRRAIKVCISHLLFDRRAVGKEGEGKIVPVALGAAGEQGRQRRWSGFRQSAVQFEHRDRS